MRHPRPCRVPRHVAGRARAHTRSMIRDVWRGGQTSGARLSRLPAARSARLPRRRRERMPRHDGQGDPPTASAPAAPRRRRCRSTACGIAWRRGRPRRDHRRGARSRPRGDPSGPDPPAAVAGPRSTRRSPGGTGDDRGDRGTALAPARLTPRHDRGPVVGDATGEPVGMLDGPPVRCASDSVDSSTASVRVIRTVSSDASVTRRSAGGGPRHPRAGSGRPPRPPRPEWPRPRCP